MSAAERQTVFNDPKFVKMYKQVEQFTGNFAAELVQRSDFKSSLSKLDKVVILDTACGTGIVSAKLMAEVDDSTVHKIDLTCADFSDAMVDAVQARIDSEKWPNAKAVKSDCQDTKLPSSHYTHIYFSFGPMLIPNPIASIKECHRELLPGGILGINTWENIGWYQDWHDALSGNPKFPALPEHETFVQGFAVTKERWDQKKFVRQHLENNGFVDVKVESVTSKTNVPVEQAVTMIPQVMRIIYSNFWAEEKDNESLKQEAEALVEEHLRQKYGEKDIEWTWVAICGLSRKPEHSEL